jgi:hypothetical protein
MTDAHKNNVMEFVNADDRMAAANYVGGLLNLELAEAIAVVDEIVEERSALAAAVNTPVIFPIGTTKKADKVESNGRKFALLDSEDDIKWVLETHVKREDLTPNVIRAFIMIGNEDAPDEIWAAKKLPTAKRKVVHCGDTVELVYTGANEMSSTV